MNKPTILCVDDEINVLEGLQDNLRKQFKVHTATSGAEALALMHSEGPFPVVISDMRMPEMNGAQFLCRVRELSPDSMRILLTGQSDLESAISAINEGEIFRFLTKPCPTEHLCSVIELALEHHRLSGLEKDLLENTLQGCVEALVEVLQLTNPEAFSRTNRLKEYVAHMAKALDLPDRWQYEVAALLSQIGFVTLPAETLKKYFARQTLDESELTLVSEHPAVAHRLISKIPRLEQVATMILHQQEDQYAPVETNPIDEAVLVGAQMLHVATEYDAQRTSGATQNKAIGILRATLEPALEVLINALALLNSAQDDDKTVYKMAIIEELRQGMVLDQEITDTNGLLLMSSGQVVTDTVIHRLNAFAQRNALEQPFRVRIAA